MTESVPRITQIQFALKTAVLMALLLTVVKFFTALWTHSLAILASCLDSGLDMFVSCINLFAAKKAAIPPDANHRYGHGKIESLASLFQSLLVGASGLFIAVESVHRLFRGTYVRELQAGIGVMVFSMAVTAVIVLVLKHVAKKHQSLILSTESLHYTMDFLTNGGILLALALVKLTGAAWWDLVFSFAVAVYILKTAFGILQTSVDELLDKSLPTASHEEIAKVVLGFHPSIVGLHNLRSRHVGRQIFLDMHVEIRGEHDFQKAHDRTEALIKRIRERFPGADITIHYDPEGAE